MIKIDVQGVELQTLKGASQIIDKDRPILIFEHEDINFPDKQTSEDAKKGLYNFFREKNYSVFYISRFSRGMLFPVQWEKHLNGDLLGLPGELV